VKNLAFVVALIILAVGAVGILEPSRLVWIAQYSLSPVGPPSPVNDADYPAKM
jgi:hypothetical protein